MRHIVDPKPTTPAWNYAAQMGAAIVYTLVLALIAGIGALQMGSPVAAVLALVIALAALAFVPTAMAKYTQSRA
ncbi:hypothetical protein I6B53_00365 [Schaalia sp. 19OD2882]|uniref:hypothetical protein n=1 Tax=Schaalia sp. 19OD2882 TaxID=2794089 RepID=UPI001C1E907F|nr:hypothetical protein [Schaalia sp. 19OD2882]QWW19636.1 hypothetical protein I6B53_00365 [Schaalia sp. 19OD2882]